MRVDVSELFLLTIDEIVACIRINFTSIRPGSMWFEDLIKGVYKITTVNLRLAFRKPSRNRGR